MKRRIAGPYLGPLIERVREIKHSCSRLGGMGPVDDHEWNQHTSHQSCRPEPAKRSRH